MKKFTFCIMTTFMLLSFVPSQLNAATVPVSSAVTAEGVKDNADLARLNEIKAMDLSSLSRSEKKELRKEVREIKNDQDGRGRYHEGHGRYHDGGNYEGRRSGGTVYFMGGGGLLVLILILLLI
jgi:hypothetical protein